MYNIPNLLFADKNGNIYDHPTLKMTGKTNSFDIVPYETELTELPSKHKINFLEGAVPLGYDQEKARIVEFEGGFPVYITPPKGYIRVLMPSFKMLKNTNMLHEEYTAVGFTDDTFYFPGIKVDILTEDITEILSFKDIIAKFDQTNNRLIKNFLKMSRKTFGEVETLTPFGNEIILDFKYLGEVKSSEIYELIDIYCREQKLPVVTFRNVSSSENSFDSFIEVLRLCSKLSPLTINVDNPILPNAQIKKILEYQPHSITIPLISPSDSFLVKNVSLALGLGEKHNDNVQKITEIFEKYGTHIFINLLTLPGFTDRSGNVQNIVDFLNTYRINSLKLSNMKTDISTVFQGEESLKEELLGIRTMLKMLKKSCKGLRFSVFGRHKDFFLKDTNLPDLKRRRK